MFDFLGEGAWPIVLLVCGGLCLVSFVPLLWLILIGRSGLMGDMIRGAFSLITGRGDPALRGKVRGDSRKDVRASRAALHEDDSVYEQRAGRSGRASVDDIRARFDDQFDRRVGDSSGTTGGAPPGGRGAQARPSYGDADDLDDGLPPSTLPPDVARRRRRRGRDLADSDDEVDYFIDEDMLG